MVEHFEGSQNGVEPHVLIPELSALGTVLNHPGLAAEFFSQITPEDLADRGARDLARMILTAHDRSEPIDAVTFLALGAPKKTLEEALALAQNPDSAPSCFGTVRANTSLRRLEAAGASLATQARLPGTSPATLLGTMQDVLRSIAEGVTAKKTLPTMAQIVEQAAQALDGTRLAPRVQTGIWSLDDTANGLPTPGVTVIAARPGMGKTALATTLIPALAKRNPDRPLIVFSLEMEATELAWNMISAISGVPLTTLLPQGGGTPVLQDNEWLALSRAQSHVASLNVVIDDTPRSSPLDMRATALRILLETQAERPTAIVIDYLQLIDTARFRNARTSREQEVAYVSREMKLLSREMGCPLLLLAQLNRNPESRADFRPRLADLRESGAVEQDADMVLLLHRPSYYAQDSEEPDEILVAKNRRGPTGTALCRFDGRCVRWRDESLKKEPSA